MKTKKELIAELEKCHSLIDFYLGRDWDTLSKEELLDRLEESKNMNVKITRLLWFTSILLLCGASFIFGLLWR